MNLEMLKEQTNKRML